MCSGLESAIRSLTIALGVLKDNVTPANQVCCVFTFSTFEPCLYDSNLTFLQSLVMHSREKCLFLHCEREVWGLAAEVLWLREKVVSLQTKEREARQHADEAEDKLKAMVAKAGEDVTELGQLRLALDLARRALKNERKSKEEAEGLAAALA